MKTEPSAYVAELEARVAEVEFHHAECEKENEALEAKMHTLCLDYSGELEKLEAKLAAERAEHARVVTNLHAVNGDTWERASVAEAKLAEARREAGKLQDAILEFLFERDVQPGKCKHASPEDECTSTCDLAAALETP